MILPANDVGSVKWRSPSNIALVKYWGKRKIQIPQNTSISFTLSTAVTETEVQYRYDHHQKEGPTLDFRFEGNDNPAFGNRILKHLHSLVDRYTWLTHCHFIIDSSNSFPHSSGIASSASAMSALALCLQSIDQEITGNEKDADFFKKVSDVARLGSGSASRSVFPKVAIWGHHKDIEQSSNDYAIPYYEPLDEAFLSFHDDILIVSPNEKSVSSSLGHSLMDGNPYASVRYAQANENVLAICESMRTGDLERFGQIVEEEAMTLHALMMASRPGYILMEPNTINIIRSIRQFRKESGLPVYFTLDAGPNIHMLYPSNVSEQIRSFRDQELLSFCYNNTLIEDRVGNGPEKIT